MKQYRVVGGETAKRAFRCESVPRIDGPFRLSMSFTAHGVGALRNGPTNHDLFCPIEHPITKIIIELSTAFACLLVFQH